jgi:hypothetical protein
MMKPDESIQIFVPLKVRKQNGRPKIMPPSTYLPSEDRTQDPHILRAIGRAWGWRRRMELVNSIRLPIWQKPWGLPNAMSADSCGLPISRRGPQALGLQPRGARRDPVETDRCRDPPWHEQPERVFD